MSTGKTLAIDKEKSNSNEDIIIMAMGSCAVADLRAQVFNFSTGIALMVLVGYS